MFKKLLKNQKGLTLVELLAVVVILGIVSSIAAVSIGNVIQSSREDAVRADAIQILNAAELFIAQGGTIGDGIGRDELDDFLTTTGSFEPDREGENGGEIVVIPGFTVTQDGAGTLRISGNAIAGSVPMTFTTASVNDINNASGEHLITGTPLS